MIRRPRERLLQMLVYEHYVRPHFNFYELATAERRLMHAFDRELADGTPNTSTAELVHRWFDKSWRRAEREWAQLRDGGRHAFYLPRQSECEAPSPEEEPAQLVLPAADLSEWARGLSRECSRSDNGSASALATANELP